MCETDIALAVLLLLGPMWLGEQAVVKSSLRNCQSFLRTTFRRGLASDEKEGQLSIPISSSGRHGRRRSIRKPRNDPSSSTAGATAGEEDLPGSSRSKRSVRFHSTPIELRRGVRRSRSVRPLLPPAADQEADPSPLVAAEAPFSAVQPTLSGCRRAVASTLRQSRSKLILARGTKIGTSARVRRASATTASFMASFTVVSQ